MDLRMVVPQATENIVTNPSFELSTDGWTANGSTISRVFSRARFGAYALQVVTDGVAPNEGVYFRANPGDSNNYYSGSVYARGSGEIRLRLIDGFNGDEYVSQDVGINDDRWKRIEVLGKTGPLTSDDLRLYIETVETKSVTFYIDGAQIEAGEFVTTYCDGDQEGCMWNLLAHRTKSTRTNEVRTAGRFINLAGDCMIDNGVYATAIGGFGYPPVENHIQDYALAEGGFFHRTRTATRIMNVLFHIVNRDAKDLSSNSLSPLHKLRKTLTENFKPDVTKNQQPILLEYGEGEGTKVYIEARYEAGMDFNQDIRNKWFNQMPVRFIANKPMFFEDDQETTQLELQQTLPDVNYVMAKEDGVWNNMNYGFNQGVLAWAEDFEGRIYAGGIFTVANNDPSAIDPQITANHIAYWDGEKWNAMGVGFNGNVSAIAIAPDGKVWVGGQFTDLFGGGGGGGAYNYIAYWDWDTETWNKVATTGGNKGMDDVVSALAFLPNGQLILAGDFDADHSGIFAYNKIARWDGSSLHTVGANNGLNASVLSLAVTKESNHVYVGGAFTSEFGATLANTLPYFCRLRTSDWNFEMASGQASRSFAGAGSAVSSLQNTVGLNNTVYKLAIDDVGQVYLTGQFTDLYDGTQEYLIRVARFNGTGFENMGSGFTEVSTGGGTLDALAVGPNNFVYVGIQNGPDVIADIEEPFGLWNGSAWTNVDFRVDIIDDFESVMASQRGNLYLGIDGATANGVNVGAQNTIDNIGSSSVFPIVQIDGPCTARYLENRTNDKILWLNKIIAEGQSLFLDFTNNRMYTTFKSPDFVGLLSQSDFGSFALLPGENEIILFVTNDVEAQAQIRYVPRHWSVDAIG